LLSNVFGNTPALAFLQCLKLLKSNYTNTFSIDAIREKYPDIIEGRQKPSIAQFRHIGNMQSIIPVELQSKETRISGIQVPILISPPTAGAEDLEGWGIFAGEKTLRSGVLQGGLSLRYCPIPTSYPVFRQPPPSALKYHAGPFSLKAFL